MGGAQLKFIASWTHTRFISNLLQPSIEINMQKEIEAFLAFFATYDANMQSHYDLSDGVAMSNVLSLA